MDAAQPLPIREWWSGHDGRGWSIIGVCTVVGAVGGLGWYLSDQQEPEKRIAISAASGFGAGVVINLAWFVGSYVSAYYRVRQA